MSYAMDLQMHHMAEIKRLTERQDQMNRIALENEKALNRVIDESMAMQTVLMKAISDNTQLTKQLTATQQRCGELLELTRERDVDAHVRQLYQGFRQDIPETPCISPVLAFRVGLVREEFEELMTACGYEQPTCDVGSSGVAMLDWKQTGKPDLVAIVGECIDIVVVTIGMLVACGVRFWPMWWAVHRSNCSKFGGPKDANGKQQKGPNYSPPAIAEGLRAQGWRE